MDMLETLKRLAHTAMRSPPSARYLLTSQCRGSRDYVESALQRALRQDPNQGAKKDWVQARQRIYVAMGLRWGTVSASRLSMGSEWWPTLKAAERDALALYERGLRPEKTHFLVDLESSPQGPRTSREQPCEEGTCVIVPALVPRGKWWIVPLNRPVVSVEKLLFLGYPTSLAADAFDSAEDATMDTCAASTVALPLQLVVAMSACAAISWKCPGDAVADTSTQAEMQEAIDFLSTLPT